MSLTLYNKKRHFDQTPEPKGKEKTSGSTLHFVVQKHDAAGLHYDFRLEHMGVLKSWAVPKGPSMNPVDKRLAMAVEDHPFDYRNFEGIIPEGNYGAGIVIVWDEGTYEVAGAEKATKKEAEALIEKRLKSGSLTFTMHGKKLKGEFTLLQLKRDQSGKSWLLVKKSDDAAITEAITLQNASVKSGKTIADFAATAGITANHPEDVSNTLKATPPRKKSTTENATHKKSGPVKTSKAITKSTLNLSADRQTLTINRHAITLTSLQKLYWKKETFSKGHMLDYYLQVAPYLLPYVLGRPQSLHRFPNGINAPGFFQKDVAGKVPDWITTYEDFSESTNQPVHYLVCTNEATLMYMANLGCIELHPWHSRVGAINNPDWCLIDLDPDTKNSYDQVVETALLIEQILASAGVVAYPKTSGSTGMHLYIPLGAKWSYEQSRELAYVIVQLTNRELPQLTSIERDPAKRRGKIYLDFLQNSNTQTAAAPYSLRPKPGMPVSAPLDWSEVKPGLRANQFTAMNILPRLKKEGDLFTPVLGRGINLPEVLKQLQTLQ